MLEAQHESFAPILVSFEDLAATAAETLDGPDGEALVEVLHLDFARFAGAYLCHMDTEERVAMPALEAALGVEGVMDLHALLLSRVTPQDMAEMQAFMIPAMNPRERCDMLAAVRAGATTEVFEDTMALARSVLTPADMIDLEASLARNVLPGQPPPA